MGLNGLICADYLADTVSSCLPLPACYQQLTGLTRMCMLAVLPAVLKEHPLSPLVDSPVQDSPCLVQHSTNFS